MTKDFLVDGYISYTFTPRAAEIYLAYLFKIDPAAVQAFFNQGAYFVWNHPPIVTPAPFISSTGHPAWLLDYRIRPGGSVVPQQIWFPQGQGDWRRYVEQAPLQMPLFFNNTDGSLGVPLVNATAGQMALLGANQPVPFSDRSTAKIRIGWPGYAPSEHQVQLRDQTPQKSPVTLDRFVKHVGSRVRQFLADCERVRLHHHDPHWKWRVAHDNVTFNEVILIGIVQVSAGSWMPILQLMNRVVM